MDRLSIDMPRNVRALIAASIVAFVVLCTFAIHVPDARAQEFRIVVGMQGSGRLDGKVIFTSSGTRTNVEMVIFDAPLNVQITGSVQAGTCDQPGASSSPLPSATVNPLGQGATAAGPLQFQGREPIALETIADGKHIVIVRVGTETLCSAIPTLRFPVPVSTAGTSTTATPTAPRTGNRGPDDRPALLAMCATALVAGVAVVFARRTTEHA